MYKRQTDVKEALLLSVTRVVLSGFIFGNLASILYSLAGGLLSLAVMALLKKYMDLSIIGVSVAGGVFHNIGQLVVAAIVVETYSCLLYTSPLSFCVVMPKMLNNRQDVLKNVQRNILHLWKIRRFFCILYIIKLKGRKEKEWHC